MIEQRFWQLPQAVRDHYDSCARVIVECPPCNSIFDYLIGNTDRIPKRLAEAKE